MGKHLEIPGRVGIGTMLVPGPNAQPVGFPMENPPGNIHIVVAGGLTKRQELAARFMAAMVSGGGVDDVPKDVDWCLSIADVFLAATEPKQPVAVANSKPVATAATSLIL